MMMRGRNQTKEEEKEESKNDPNASIAAQMPFSEMKDSDKMEKARAFRESYKKANLGPDNIPSICMYR